MISSAFFKVQRSLIKRQFHSLRWKALTWVWEGAVQIDLCERLTVMSLQWLIKDNLPAISHRRALHSGLLLIGTEAPLYWCSVALLNCEHCDFRHSFLLSLFRVCLPACLPCALPAGCIRPCRSKWAGCLCERLHTANWRQADSGSAYSFVFPRDLFLGILSLLPAERRALGLRSISTQLRRGLGPARPLSW